MGELTYFFLKRTVNHGDSDLVKISRPGGPWYPIIFFPMPGLFRGTVPLFLNFFAKGATIWPKFHSEPEERKSLEIIF